MKDAGTAMMGIGLASGENAHSKQLSRPRTRACSRRRSRGLRAFCSPLPAARSDAHRGRCGGSRGRGMRRAEREHHLRTDHRRVMKDDVRITVIATGFKSASPQQSSMDFSAKDLFAPSPCRSPCSRRRRPFHTRRRPVPGATVASPTKITFPISETPAFRGPASMALPDSLPAPHLTARRSARVVFFCSPTRHCSSALACALRSRDERAARARVLTARLISEAMSTTIRQLSRRTALFCSMRSAPAIAALSCRIRCTATRSYVLTIQLLLRSMQRAGEPLMEPMRLRLQWKALRRCYALRTACP